MKSLAEKIPDSEMNVTELELVDIAHPTVCQGFWVSSEAYFSAIRLRDKQKNEQSSRQG